MKNVVNICFLNFFPYKTTNLILLNLLPPQTIIYEKVEKNSCAFFCLRSSHVVKTCINSCICTTVTSVVACVLLTRFTRVQFMHLVLLLRRLSYLL